MSIYIFGEFERYGKNIDETKDMEEEQYKGPVYFFLTRKDGNSIL